MNHRPNRLLANPRTLTLVAIEAHLPLTAALIGLVVLAGPVSTEAQSIERVGDDRISVRAESVPLGPLLRKLATVAPLETLVIEESVESVLVSVSFDNATFKEGILEILKAAKVSYVVQGGDGEPFHLFAGDPEDRTQGRSLPAPEPDEPSSVGGGSAGTEPDEPGSAGGESAATERDEPGSGAEGTQQDDRSFPTPVFAPPGSVGGGSGGKKKEAPPREVTGGALLLERPAPARVAMTVTLLGFGLLLGVPLAGYRPGATLHRLLKRQRQQNDQRRRTAT